MKDDERELQSKLFTVFKEEAKEHLQELSKGLFDLEEKGDPATSKEVAESLFRSVHSLKGAARAVSFFEVEQLCASLEDVLDLVRKNTIKPNDAFFEVLFQSSDVLEKIIFGKDGDAAIVLKVSASELCDKLEQLIDEKGSLSVDEKKNEEKPPLLSAAKIAKQTPEKVEENGNHSDVQVPAKSRVIDTIRISSFKIDQLLQHVEEMLMIKLTSKEKLKEIEGVYFLLEEWGKWSAQNDIEKKILKLQPSPSSKMAREGYSQEQLNELSSHFEKKNEYFKKAFASVAKLKRLAEQDLRMISGLVDSVIVETKEILMQPFSTVLEGFPKMARDLSQSLGKQVALEIQGDEIEVDRRILEQLKDPLIHILRNSLDHGIEAPESRTQKGKDPKGKIIISARQMKGNSFEVRFSDDGQGIDFKKVMEKGIEEGLISQHLKDTPSKEELSKLIFMPGFSTNKIVTDLSGRGVGLNVLSENVEKLGGSIRIGTDMLVGTEFIITLPLTLSTFRGIHIRVGEQEFIIPTHHVIRVFRGMGKDIKTVQGKKTVHFEGKNYSFAELSEVLLVPVKKEKEGEDCLKPRLLIKAGEIEIAFGVDAIYNEQEVFVKGLGKQLQRVKNISASTIMDWGRVIPILDPFDLVKSAAASSRSSALISSEHKEDGPHHKSVIVIDDSITSRMLLKNILESAGYKVRTAVDGLEGYSLLLKEEFDLVLSDVEMPRMNGFDLTKKIRESEKFKEKPVILCTSRGSPEDRQMGIECGANAYLDKSNFMQKNLLEIIEQLL